MSRPTLQDLSIVLGVALALRLLATLTLPLIVTNDGAFYLLWGTELAAGRWPDLPATRTPGYPAFLAAIIAAAGNAAFAIAAAQHALGVLCAVCVWVVGRCIAGRRVALTAGVIVAVDPWLLGMSSYALAETLSVSLVLAAIAAAVVVPRTWTSVIGGVLLGCAVLVRPSTMAWVPGLVLVAASLPTPRWPQRLARCSGALLGIVLAVGPWLAFNASRGVSGLAQTDGLALWGGLARAGLLEPDFELPPGAPPPPAALFRPQPRETVLLGYFRELGRELATDRAEVASAWSRASIAADPAGYGRAVVHAAAWQSNAMLPGTPYRHDSMRWLMRRLGGLDAPADRPSNLSTAHLPDLMLTFGDDPASGPLAFAYRHWPFRMFQCVPQLPLGVLTLAACGALAWKRRWTAAAVLASSFPIVLGHAALLQPFARYSISAWMLWWLGGAIALHMAWQLASVRVVRLVRHPVPE